MSGALGLDAPVLDALAAAAKVWVTEGPNSGGRAGWLLTASGHLRWFWQDFGASDLGPPVTPAQFLADHAGVTDRRAAIVAWLRGPDALTEIPHRPG